jgi:hypothetical protein
MEDFLDLELKALTHPDPLERLRACQLILDQLDQQMLESIRQARREGMSWEQISRTLRGQQSL